MSNYTKEFCVVGGGIAGLSIACHLSAKSGVCVLERESDLAYHTSGRSAAVYSEIYTDGLSGLLSTLSRSFFDAPPAGFTEQPLIETNGCLHTATAEEAGQLRSIHASRRNEVDGLELLEPADASARVPIIRTEDGAIRAALWEPLAARLDVAELLAGYRKNTLHNGGDILCGAEVVAIEREQDQWKITLADGRTVLSEKIVNAAGAWGDVIAEMAGVKPIGLSPLRRTMIIFDGPEGEDVREWPAVGGIAGGYYYMSEAGKLMGSSADEVPSAPCDAQPEEYDIALAAYNIESATTLEIKHIHHKWAGLRTFAPDRQPVIGWDPSNPDFFWLVGQGGTGIQTAPALSQLAAGLAMREPIPADLLELGITEQSLGRARLNV
jgi:D-arginine dehydrogenase